MPHPRPASLQVTAWLAAALLTLVGCTASRSAPGSDGTRQFADNTLTSQVYEPGKRVTPDAVTGELLDGAAFDLVSLRGQVVVVNWWGSWCAPCRAETEHLVAAFEATKGLGVAFVGVDVRDDRDAARAFVADFAVPYPSLFDPAGQTTLKFTQVNPNVVPTTVVLDRSGRVATIFRKAVVGGELEPVVERVAAENRPTPTATGATR
jgi:peroxiredoxin